MKYIQTFVLASFFLSILSSSAFSDLKYPSPPKEGANINRGCEIQSSGNKTLVLIDATDNLKPGQMAFVEDNFVKNFKWQEKGDSITYVILHDSPVQLMKFVTLCAPKPEASIDYITDSPAKIKSLNRKFRKNLIKVFKDLVVSTSKSKAKQTLLIEAIAEIYRNKRYQFTHGETRNLILISDLYQHSNIISHLRICKRPTWSGDNVPLTCPSFSQTLKENPRFRNYIKKAKPNLKDGDSITTYYLNVGGRVDRSAEKWWKQYFSKSGLSANNLNIIPELQ